MAVPRMRGGKILYAGVYRPMRDAEIATLAGRQFNRMTRRQLLELGLSENAIDGRVAGGRLVILEDGVLAVAPVLDDKWGDWMGATLTAPRSYLSQGCAGAAWGFWSWRGGPVTITRPGSGGPRRLGGLRVYRSSMLDADVTILRGIPITTVTRTLVDLAAGTSERALARAVREAVRLGLTTVAEIGESLGRYRGRRGVRRLASVVSRYTGLPLERARSGAEIRAIEILAGANHPLPRLNISIAGEEADLSWPRERSIIEIDGGPFHLDVGEDARKQAVWEQAGWTVLRLPAADVYEHPHRLLRLAPPPNVPQPPT